MIETGQLTLNDSITRKAERPIINHMLIMKSNSTIVSIALSITLLIGVFAFVPTVFANSDCCGGFDSGGYEYYDFGGFDSGGYEYYDYGGFDSGGYDYYDYGGFDSGGYDYYDYGGFDSGGYDYAADDEWEIYGIYGQYETQEYAEYAEYAQFAEYAEYAEYDVYDVYDVYDSSYAQSYQQSFLPFQSFAQSIPQSYQVPSYQQPSFPFTPYVPPAPRPTPQPPIFPPQPPVIQPPVIPPADVCPNLPGFQSSVPNGYTIQNGQCVPAVCPPGTIGNYPTCTIPQPPQQPSVTTINTNTNTCTGGSCNTNIQNNINNSINDSFNTVNSGNTTVTQLAPVTPQPIVQYTIPAPQYPVYPQPTYQQGLYCVLTASPTVLQNGQTAYLSWTSQGATSAMLSDGLGYVSPNGSMAVRPESTRYYTLTVYGPGGVRTCNATVTVVGSAPYVSLTQIPYTGFDMGPIGNAMYWVALLSFAIAGAYLAVYYIPQTGLLAFARSNRAAATTHESAIIVAPQEAPREDAHVAPDLASLPTAAHGMTRDSMSMSRSESGIPRIVISRA